MRAAPRPYRNIGIFFLLLLLLVVAGFTPRVAGTPFFGYVGTVLRGGQVPAVLHVHALVSIGWLLLLVVQAFLIRAGRHSLHRALGWTSVLLVSVLLLTSVQAMQHFYRAAITRMPVDTALSLLAQSVTALSLLLVFYTLALLRRKHLHQHVAFMVAASLATATPGLARLGLYVVGGLPGILAVVLLIYATLAAFLIHARRRYRQPILRSPYLLALLLFFLAHVMDFVGSQSAGWRWLARQLVAGW